MLDSFKKHLFRFLSILVVTMAAINYSHAEESSSCEKKYSTCISLCDDNRIEFYTDNDAVCPTNCDLAFDECEKTETEKE